MKHLYALITAFGIEFSTVSFSTDHDLSHQQPYEESGYYADYGFDTGYDYGADYGRAGAADQHGKMSEDK